MFLIYWSLYVDSICRVSMHYVNVNVCNPSEYHHGFEVSDSIFNEIQNL